MSTCPFCSKPISEDLSLNGGYCPHCLIEIPGEESATDPGLSTEEVKGEQGSNNRWLLMGTAALVLVSVGWWWSHDGGSTSGVNFRGARPAVPLSAHQDQQYEDEKAKQEAAAAPKRSRRSRRASAPANQAKAAPAQPAAKTDRKPASSDSVAAGLGSAPVDIFSAIGAAPRQRGPKGIVLEDAVKIEEMVARVLTRGSRDVQRCFDTARKANPSTTGAWYVGFTVSKEGRPVEIGIERLGAANATIEACIQSSVSSMRFQRVAEQVHVSDTYRMGG